MPRYLVERSFAEGLHIPMDAIGAKTCAEVVGTNLDYGVTWLHSYVTPDKTKAYCICDAPSPRNRPPERPGPTVGADAAASRSTTLPRSAPWAPISTPSSGQTMSTSWALHARPELSAQDAPAPTTVLMTFGLSVSTTW